MQIVVKEEDQVLLIANTGNLIRMQVKQISETGRSTSGVKLMDLDKKEKVQHVATFKIADTFEEQDVQQ